MARASARLGDLTFDVDPVSVKWDYRVRMSEQHTIGGRVIQVFGTDLGDMIVTGTVGRGSPRKGDTEPWEAMERLLDKFEDLADHSARTSGRVTHRFTVPSKGWAFDVYVKAVAPITYSEETPSPTFTLTLFIVEDITGKVSRGITDKYIERLAKGIGWSQSEYNGPTEEEVEARLAPFGGSPAREYKQMIVDAFTSAMGGGGGTSGPGSFTGGPEDLGRFMWALRDQESGHNYTAQNPGSSASGAYQYIDSTWGGYKGYARAYQAPPGVQDEKAAADIMRFYSQWKDWGLVASCWLTGHAVGPNGPNAGEWNQTPGHPSNPTVAQYVTSVLSKMQSAPS